MEQSANPAAIVRHYTRTISTSTQNASVWSLTAAAPSDSVFCALCINWLTCLLVKGNLASFHTLTFWRAPYEVFIGIEFGIYVASTEQAVGCDALMEE